MCTRECEGNQDKDSEKVEISSSYFMKAEFQVLGIFYVDGESTETSMNAPSC